MTFSPPAIDPLSRLQVSQGLLITTERWKHAQTYHRQRQNLHYQSLHQPGIVRGFGVCEIPSPAQKNPQYLWVKIAPGIAIDIQGNPIILKTPLDFGFDPFKLDFKQDNLQTVYLVAQYVDPDSAEAIAFSKDPQPLDPDTAVADSVQENCRFIQRSRAELQPNDVELCRIRLQPGHVQLRRAKSVHFPGGNTLDFRHRLTAQPRSEGTVQVGQIYVNEEARETGQKTFQPLLQATQGLSKTIQGEGYLHDLSLTQLNQPRSANPTPEPSALAECQLTYLRRADLFSLSGTGQERLQRYLQQGGVIVVEADPEIQPFEKMQQKLVETVSELSGEKALKAEIQTRIDQLSDRINHNINTLCEELKTFAQQLNYPIEGEGHIASNHPLRVSPFTFSSWPSTGDQTLRIFCWEGIVLVLGDLSELWTTDSTTEKSRQDIRMAQEWGLNLFHYAWKHHQLTQLQLGRTDHA